jgi:prepilin-type N-terminal cleavage/methylation domain-containing protein
MRQRKRGFTLVEIMITVAIIALLAAIAIPNLLRVRHNANESAAIASLRTISTAEESFWTSRTPNTYGTLVAMAMPASNPPYIDATLAAGTKQGYAFTITNLTANTYTCTAVPVTVGTTGTRIFSVDQTGVIMDNTNNLPIT